MRLVALLSALSLAAVSTAASAQQRPAPARAPELALALEAAQTAVNTCLANGVKAAASIVDSAGLQKVFLAADGASKGAIESSVKKATTANALKMSTHDAAEKVKTDQALAEKVKADPTLFVRPGGLPLMVGNDVIGAIGVGGASTLNGVQGGDRDAVCAQAGLDKVKARLK